MPKTRNQMIAAWFNRRDWPLSYDTAMMDALERRSRMHPDLRHPELFESIMEGIREDMMREFGKLFSLHAIKVRVNVMRNRFYDFLGFIHLPGVKFNIRTNKVRCTYEYHQHCHGVIELTSSSFSFFTVMYFH